MNGNGVISDENSIRLMGQSSGSLSLSKVSLPIEYDISFKVNFNHFEGDLTLGVTAEEYLQDLNNATYKSNLKSRYFFEAISSGQIIKFGPVLYRRQDYTNSQVEKVCRSEAQISNKDTFYQFNIVMTAYYLRIFCEGELIYMGPSTFYGGTFDIKYYNESDSSIYIKDVVVKNIRSYKNKNITNQYRLPTPTKALTLFYNESKFPQSSKLIFSDRLFNSNKWITEMLRGKAKETSNGLELYLLANMTKTLDIELRKILNWYLMLTSKN